MIVGGITPSAIAFAMITPSIPPAAPRPCPVAPLVEDMYKSLALSPNKALIALVSTTSFVGVEVPWALMYVTSSRDKLASF